MLTFTRSTGQHLVAALLIAFAFSGVTSTQAANILMLTSDINSVQSYSNFLSSTEGGGHNVTVSTGYTGTLSASQKSEINTYDLAIVTGNTGSADYPEADWNALTVPILLNNAFTARSNRWGMINSTGTHAADVASIDVNAPDHPVFHGITINNGSLAIYDPATNIALAGASGQAVPDGSLLGSWESEGSGRRIFLAEWEAGEAYYNGGAIPAGHRMFLATAVQSQSGTIDPMAGLTDDGKMLLANAVNYMIPEPSSLILLGAGSFLLMTRRHQM